MIKRDLYLSKIRPFIRKGLIKVLVGQRRVGKSMILKMIAEEISLAEIDANIIYIDKEDYAFNEIKNQDHLDNYLKENEKSGMNYLFIDEVQEIEGFELILRSYIKKSNYDIFCTGSNAKIFSSELTTYLSGRQMIFQIGSLNFIEFCQFHNLSPNQESLLKFIKFGGLPYLINLSEDENVRFEYLNGIFSTILLRDIVNRHQIRDPRFLTDLLRFIADNTGSIFSATKISNYLKSQKIQKNVSIILNYLSYIEDAYLINKVQRTDIQGKKLFEVGEKYYFEDLGLRNVIVGFKMQDIGNIMENIVFLHLRNFGYTINIGYSDKKEIDFIAEKNNERKYFQVTYLLSEPSTIEREFGNLLKINDNYPKYVISLDEFSTPNSYAGIFHLTLLEFLTTFNS